ncbi:MAG: hypothetical protein JNL11_17260 [Bdellovibrionaceae bacterium]|nr:hypothetical protein [Pseudobdellovibrionaceae bacterium]
MKNGIFWLGMFVLFMGSLGFAQNAKHPRVVELEKTLSREALEVLKGRFPDKPFLVNVRIDPMMRDRKSSSGVGGERLPYYEISEEEVVDEWDDPNVPVLALINRVRKIQVNMSVPAQLSDEEISELKSSVIYNLGLVEARDSVEVNKRNWNAFNLPKDNSFDWSILGYGMGAWILIMAGLLFITWLGTNRLAQSIQDSAISQKGNGNGGGGIVNATINATGGSGGDSGKAANFGSADLKLQDPIKNREIIASGLKILDSHQNFPNLEDMLILQKAAEERPNDLGALLSEFPFELRQRLFSYSFGEKWMEVMIDPSDVTSFSLEILNRCLKIQRNETDRDWLNLLIYVWRLNSHKKEFFNGIPQADAFSILFFLPKSFAIEAARESFPGAWGQLLDPTFTVKKLGKEKTKEYTEKAIRIAPLRDLAVLENYKNERELLGFLKVSDPVAEKEIYLASGDSSILWSIRPPFFKVFELNGDEYDKLVGRFKIEEWAMAMFNVGRVERREIEKRMSDKQKFRYFEMLKSYDMKNPAKSRVGEIRESVGKIIAEIQAESAGESALETKSAA